ncbi:MAG TPA: hypothetical protein VII16_16970, partial [Actinomycetes bacterium]
MITEATWVSLWVSTPTLTCSVGWLVSPSNRTSGMLVIGRSSPDRLGQPMASPAGRPGGHNRDGAPVQQGPYRDTPTGPAAVSTPSATADRS